jgi:hypothetical protein
VPEANGKVEVLQPIIGYVYPVRVAYSLSSWLISLLVVGNRSRTAPYVVRLLELAT